MTIKDKIETIQKLIDKIPSIKASQNERENYESWCSDVCSLTRKVFGDYSVEYEKINEIINKKDFQYPAFCTDSGIYIRKSDSTKGLNVRIDKIKNEPSSYIKALALLDDSETWYDKERLEILIGMLGRFEERVSNWYLYYTEKPEMSDEKKVQIILYDYLKPMFKDLEREAVVPRIAGQNCFIDFLLHEAKIGIEVKMSSATHKDKKICDELILDLFRYPNNPECKCLVCFIYDPNFDIVDREKIRNDFERRQITIPVKIIFSPRKK